jgi:steroid delta-isomerase
MSIENNLAYIAGRLSPKLAMAKEIDDWVEMYSDDALLQDPVGISPLDPSGLGHKGTKAIRAFAEMVMIPENRMDFVVYESYPCGDECANIATIYHLDENGKRTGATTDLVPIYKVNEAGKVTAMQAYWHFDPSKDVSEHPAYIAGRASPAMAVAGDKQGWLDLFAEDAVLEDPVGKSPLDPIGKGHRGLDEISRFWDLTSSDGQLEFNIKRSFVCQNTCVNIVSLTNSFNDGNIVSTDLVAKYEVNDAGKIISLKAYWVFSEEAQVVFGE